MLGINDVCHKELGFGLEKKRCVEESSVKESISVKGGGGVVVVGGAGWVGLVFLDFVARNKSCIINTIVTVLKSLFPECVIALVSTSR